MTRTNSGAALRRLPIVFASLLALSTQTLVASAAEPAPKPNTETKSPATVTDAVEDAREAHAVLKAWDRYAELSSKNAVEAADLVAVASDAHFAFLRDAALYAAPEQLRRIPLSDRVLTYLFRANFEPTTLKTMDGRALIRACMSRGWCGVSEPDEGEELPSLTYITVLGDEAIGEYGPPTESQYQFGPAFVRENGQWRYRYESLAADTSQALQQQIANSGVGTEEMLELMLNALNGEGKPLPAMAVLDRAPEDDSAARTRLNEKWPKYDRFFALRGRALEQKAAHGDTLAQTVLGALLYSGSLPTAIAQDKPRGIGLLEQASDNGSVRAASAMIEILLEQRPEKGKPFTQDYLARLARHSRRAAEGGTAAAAMLYASMLFNGAGGLQKDCVLAEEWSARAEDGGISDARNERVWFLATCPIPAQRRPARALELAAYMIENADSLSAGELDTVAAAYAANGKFAEAVGFQQRAIDKLEPQNKRTLKAMNERLGLYKRDQDWVDNRNTFAEPAE